jgi:sirohydrochlorin cobaltochelatase
LPNLEAAMNVLILLGHGSRDASGLRPLAQICAWTRAARPDWDVREAYLSLNQPTLEACLEGLQREGVDRVRILPMLVSRGHHLNVELPSLLEGLRARYPNLVLELLPHLGADPAIVDLVLRRVAPLPAFVREA